MASKKAKKSANKNLEVVTEQFRQLYLALGRACLVLKLVQGSLKKDKVTLRVNALQLRDQIRDLQKRQRQIFTELQKAKVLEKGA